MKNHLRLVTKEEQSTMPGFLRKFISPSEWKIMTDRGMDQKLRVFPKKSNWVARVGYVIRLKRKINGISQAEFAESLGISQSAVSKIENGILETSSLHWVTICDWFGIDYRLVLRFFNSATAPLRKAA